MNPFQHLIASSVVVLCSLSASQGREDAATYGLGPGDKLRISVHEWRAQRNELFEWTAPKGEFTIDPEGKLFLPVVGEIRAEPLKAGELANLISEQLQSRLGLVQRPETSVQVVSFRPFYILGYVNKPGDYPYWPGINVLQAVSIAGGFYRAGEGAFARFERESITAKGELRVYEAEQIALFARRARLLAELENADKIDFPKELTQQRSATATRILREEQLLFESRRQGLRSQIDALEQGKTLIQREIISLKAKDATQERQMKLAKKDLENVNSLVSKGLAIAARQLALEQTLAQIESARQDLTLAVIRAEQEVNRAERQSLDLQNKRRNEILAELRTAQTRIRELQEKSDTASQLAFESEVIAPRLAERQAETDVAPPTFKVIRPGASGPQEIEASPTDVLQPGDILTVERPSRSAVAPAPSPRRESSAAGLPSTPESRGRLPGGTAYNPPNR